MAKNLSQQITDMQSEIKKRAEEATRLEGDAGRLALTNTEAAVDADSRALALRRLIPRLRAGLAQLVEQKTAADIQASDAAIDAETARRLQELEKDFPSLTDAVDAVARSFNGLLKHRNFPRLAHGREFLHPSPWRELVSGMPGIVDEWRAENRKKAEDEAKKAKAEARKQIEEAAQDFLEDGQDAREVKAS